ncbi:hypothetical protein ETJ91_00415 [Bacillus albus]|uniref:hypothetical protein n=1 Tax=Bacillus albus TaxID=2026189 RepID=UPI001009C754|nr:hypothetical protein [Bacillus albus]RXJ19867.1 hypothetical protein ETJ91_00415 [Bacillus albus]RXJ30056.1 hypothetical protein ETJ76_15675 [Bacillus albus]RXJ31648.1 hypothetical protein ETJ90_08450 [Bacillus albus]RXJ42872.1 hypothetical protein ETJ89_08455 [Bacillus albus]RXJ59800.1 hypothetical protein ETJ66_08450 [Bacillus albus]
MGVTIRSTNNSKRYKRALEKLGKKEIKVGIFGEDNYEYGNDADLVTIAGVHEFGTTIKPKNADYLTIPLIPAAKNKRASDFPGLVPIGLDDGSGVLAMVNGDKIEPVFALLKSVTIPERSFIRTGFDNNVEKIGDKIDMLFTEVVELNIDPDVFADMIGMEFAGMIQRHARTVSSPPNAASTRNVKGSSNPLHDTGRMIGAIRHEVE